MKMASHGMTHGGQFLLRTLVALLLAASIVPAALAQDTDADTETGTIKGTVTSTRGGPIVGARILITDRTTGKTVALRTDGMGAFASAELPATDYTARAEIRGFITASAVVAVKAGAAATLDLKMGPEPLPGVVSTAEIEHFPLRSLNFLNLLQLEPGVQNQNAGSLAANKGAYSSASLFNNWGSATPVEADGLSITDGVNGGVVQNLPASAVQEFQLGGLLGPITNQLYGPGALNVITRSGGNDLHGNLFGFYGNGDVLSASLPSRTLLIPQAGQAPLRLGGPNHHWGRQDYGGSLGGALVPDKFFFFLSADRGRQDFRNTVNPGAPFEALNPAYTTIDEPFRGVSGMGRLDYKWSDQARAFYRFAYDQNSVLAPFSPGSSLQPILVRSNTPSHSVGLDLTSGSFVHSFRFEYLKFRNVASDASSLVPVMPSLTGLSNFDFNIGGGSTTQCSSGALICVGSSPFANQQNYQSNEQLRYDGSRVSGKHTLHVGVSYDRISVGRSAPLYSTAPVLSDQGNAVLPFAAGGPSGVQTDPSSYPVQWAYLSNGRVFQSEKSGFNLPGGALIDNQLSAYAGDTWKITPNLAVTYGATWVRDTVPNNSDLGSIALLNAWQPKLGNRVRQPNYNFAPHLGVAWDTSSNGTTTIRAGVGMFYDHSSFLNAYSDRVLRLQQGTYFATVPACIGGAGARIQWPTTPGMVPGGIVNSDGTVSPYDPASNTSWCGESMGIAAPLALQLQQAYQSALGSVSANPSFLGNPGAFASPMLNGLSLLSPNFQTPRTVRANIGLRHELRPGLVFTADYVRQVTTRSLLGVDVNQGGAAATFNQANALAARDNAQTSNGCSAGTNQVNCLVGKLGYAGALEAYGAAGIGGPAQVTGGAPCSFCAFPGIHPNLGVNVVDSPEGRSVYSGTLLSLNQEIMNFSPEIRRAGFKLSYLHSKYVSQGQDETLAMLATDYANPDRFTGPGALDRTHQLSLAAFFDLRHSLQVSFLSHFASPLPVTMRFQQNGGGAEVLVTDWNGDGSTGDIVPGSSVGSYMRSQAASKLSTFINSYNVNTSSNVTPAGSALVNAGVFSFQDLQLMGGALQPLAVPVQHVAGLGWFKTFDARVGWEHQLGERVTITPSVSLYNLFNFANFDVPGNTQSGYLAFGAGSVSSSHTAVQPQNTVGGNASGPGGRTNRASLGPNMNASGAPRSVEWGLKISF